ncbi:MAG: hypothetical protein LBN38_03310 [Verrucomicrobiota bacterium]|nr:hypothetical protein [Verrucomicrobiota bacterium]
MRRGGPFFAIAWLTALEAIRRPVFLLVALSCLAGITLLPWMLNYTLGDSGRIIRDSALSFTFVGGLLLAAYAAGETLSRELQRGTAAVLLAKPVKRPVFFLAKTLGIILAILLFTLAALSATLLAVRAGANDLMLDRTAALPALAALLLGPAAAGIWNHHTGRPFTSTAFLLLCVLFPGAVLLAAGLPPPFESLAFAHTLPWPILQVGVLIFFALCMVTSAASALATRLPLSAVLLLCAGLFLGGLMSDYVLGPHLEASWLARLAYAVLPNVQAFWLLDALDGLHRIPSVYVLTAAGYAAAWSALCLLAGSFSFQKLEIS